MKTNKLIYNFLVGLGAILLALPIFVSVWTMGEDSNFTLFEEFGDGVKLIFKVNEGGFVGFWATLVAIVTVVALVAALLYFVLFVIELTNKKKSFAGLKKILAFVMLVCGVIALIAGIVFTSKNKVMLGNKVLYSMKMAVGFYLLVAGALIGGLFGLLGAKRK